MSIDLISREALKKAMNEEALNLSNGGSIFIENINKVIDNAPAIIKCGKTLDGLPLMDLRPRPQGKWLKDYVHFKCSNCGEEAPYIYPNEHERFIEVRTNYCPHCGAEMGE